MEKIKKGLIWFFKSFLWIIPLLFFFDILTKQLFEKVILKEDGNSIVVIKNFLSFTLTHNTGAAWGIFADMDWLLITFSVVCGTGMVIFLIIKYKKLNLLTKISLFLMISGAYGNLIDRAFYEKKVIDFIQFTFIDFPIFNLADMYLVIGVIMLIISEIIYEFVSKKKEAKAIEKKERTTEDIISNDSIKHLSENLQNNLEEKKDENDGK